MMMMMVYDRSFVFDLFVTCLCVLHSEYFVGCKLICQFFLYKFFIQDMPACLPLKNKNVQFLFGCLPPFNI
ncbi:hypothetical protein L6452_37036 [Arctium lappa]|uniref:Uncharacterized protein n=1 Tax=Arctium lappa TaxID=4217 RepID=A0ACB8Y2K7_ARCLA|nr:hypothetical protein L6452_37036 [Arctium lappa]